MTVPHDLRAKAAQFRRVASVHTTGGHATDRELVELAARLESEAREIERKAAMADKLFSGD